MSLYITAIYSDKSQWTCEYHMGVDNSAHFNNIIETLAIDCALFEVQADGHELEAIKEQFPGILCPVNNRVVRWYGETAIFIVGNIKMK